MLKIKSVFWGKCVKINVNVNNFLFSFFFCFRINIRKEPFIIKKKILTDFILFSSNFQHNVLTILVKQIYTYSN